MAMTALNPLKGIRLFFQGLSGSLDEEYDDDEGFDKKELEELNKMSEKNIDAIEEAHGKQTLVVDDDKEDKDRLGIKKPKILKRAATNDKAEQEQKDHDQEDERDH